MTDQDLLLELLQEEEQHQARKSHLKFMKYTWMKGPEEPFIVGHHTREICREIDEAFECYREGKSTYLLINVHQRAGKSDIVSRYLGPHFLGEFQSSEVMQVTYASSLAAGFSAYGRNIFKSDKFNKLYPTIKISKETAKKDDWHTVDLFGNITGGKLYASGLQSGLTGNGFSLGILDDYFAGRAEAESQVQRNKAWEAFTNDFMTRRAPTCIVIVLATIWHWDDITGRIKKEMEKNPDFPQFKTIAFPARSSDYKGGYLFLERYSPEWYKSQYATLGRYSAAALMDCDPQLRTGGILSLDGIKIHEPDDQQIPGLHDIQWAYVWDLAHTAKQRSSDDPDYTSGTLLGFQEKPGDPIPHLWIKKRVRMREGAVKRDARIKLEAKMAGPWIWQAIENSIESKDAYEYIKNAMPEYNFRSIPIKGDKAVRAAPLEPIFEAPDHVHLVRGEWIDDWMDEVLKFTGTGDSHDDGVDNLSAGYILLIGKKPAKFEYNKPAKKSRVNKLKEGW